MFLSWVMLLKLSKKVLFLQFSADLSKKFKSVQVIYINASERSRYALSENSLVYYSMTAESASFQSILGDCKSWYLRAVNYSIDPTFRRWNNFSSVSRFFLPPFYATVFFEKIYLFLSFSLVLLQEIFNCQHITLYRSTLSLIKCCP